MEDETSGDADRARYHGNDETYTHLAEVAVSEAMYDLARRSVTT